MRGEGRPAGQHESAAAGAETAQPAGGPGGGDGAPPVPRPHQRGGPAGKPPGVARARSAGGPGAARGGAGAGPRPGRLLSFRGEAGPTVVWVVSSLWAGFLAARRSPRLSRRLVGHSRELSRLPIQHLLPNVSSVLQAVTSGLRSAVGEYCPASPCKALFFYQHWILAIFLQRVWFFFFLLLSQSLNCGHLKPCAHYVSHPAAAHSAN